MIIAQDTIMNLRNNSSLKSQDLCLGLDLVRVESLQSLDQNTVSRLLQKNYRKFLLDFVIDKNLKNPLITQIVFIIWKNMWAIPTYAVLKQILKLIPIFLFAF